MHSSHMITLLATAFFALSATAASTIKARAEAVDVCGDFVIASTPMCCNQDTESEGGLDCKEGQLSSPGC